MAGIESKTLSAEENTRGRGKAVTLQVRYRFETPTAEELTLQIIVPYTGRNGHMEVNVLGLTLIRTYEGLNFAADRFANARDAAREILRANATMYTKDVIARVFAQTGESISSASVLRMRSRLKQVELLDSNHMEEWSRKERSI